MQISADRYFKLHPIGIALFFKYQIFMVWKNVILLRGNTCFEFRIHFIEPNVSYLEVFILFVTALSFIPILVNAVSGRLHDIIEVQIDDLDRND